MLTRRIFLRGSAVVMAGMGAAPSWLARAAAAESRKNKTLVAIFLRGAADGLNIVVPFGDKRYRELRPTLAIAPPSRTERERLRHNRPRRDLRVERRFASAEGPLGQPATCDCRGNGLTRPFALAL